MIFHQVPLNPNFVGRERELKKLAEIHKTNAASIIVVSGRRRIGKTELIEQFFRSERLLKFEGIQTAPSRGRGVALLQQKQIEACIHRLRIYGWEIPPEANISSWTSFFEFISPFIEKEPVVLYFEEIQWLCSYQDNFLAELKPFWDDRWRHNQHLRIVLSGSSPSFIASQFLSNKAIYNRSDYSIELQNFSPMEVQAMLSGRGLREILVASLTLGGIPGYLTRLHPEKSVVETLRHECCSRDGFFFKEFDRIFVSSLAHSNHYRKTIEMLAKKGPLSRSDLAKKVVGTERAGGEFTKILTDLSQCGFIEEYPSVHRSAGTKLCRYRISDSFLLFYDAMILPRSKEIRDGKFQENWNQALPEREFTSFLGLAFERWVRENVVHIARLLGFSGVEFHSGSFFERSSKGVQIDLLIERSDHTLIIAEAKYSTTPLRRTIAAELDEKIERLFEAVPRYRSFSVRKLLVVSDSALVPQSLREQLDFVLSADQFFQPAPA